MHNLSQHQNQHKSATASSQFVLYGMVAVMAFGFGFLATFLVNNWDTINTLFYETSLAKYEIMSGQRGPATYLIFHEDFTALQTMADQHTGILGVEQAMGSNVAKMAFVSAKSPLIEDVRQLASVSSMINRNVPMMCH